MKKETLRDNIKKHISNAQKVPQHIGTQVLAHLQDKEWWDNLPEPARNAAQAEIKKIKERDSVSYEEIKQKYPRWFKK